MAIVDALWSMFGNKDEGNKVAKVKATVLSKDESGTVWVHIEGGVTETPVYSTTIDVSQGDTVMVRVEGGKAYIDGSTSDPSIGVRRMVQAIEPVAKDLALAKALSKTAKEASEAAQRIATEAQEAAQAVSQYFWQRSEDTQSDGAGTGAFVTEETQEDFLEAAADGFPDLSDEHPHHNLLMNSLGILLRTGLKNLVSITRSAIAFYDGLGNDAANVVASFGNQGARVGKNSGNHMTVEADGIYGWYDDELIFGAQNNNGAAELYLGQNESTIPIAGSLDTFDQNGAFIEHMVYMTGIVWLSPAPTYPVPPNAARNEYRPSSPISSGHFEFADSGSLLEFRLYDSGDAMYLKVLRKSLGSSSERTGISPESYVVQYSHNYYELAWFDGSGTEISAQHENVFVLANYLLSPQSYEFVSDGIIMRRDSTKPSIRFCDDELIPFFMKAGWDETFDQSELPALPCIVMNTLDRRLWVCYSDSIRPVGNIRGADSLASDLATADGTYVSATGDYSHAQNLGTVAAEDAQTAIGKFNADEANAALIIGNGTQHSDRSNAFWVNWNGRLFLGRAFVLRSDAYTGTEDRENFVGIYAQTENREGWALRVFGGPDSYGDAVVIGDGGLFVAGAGESAESMYNAIIDGGSTQGQEDTFLTADGYVFIIPNCNTIANRIEYNFGSGGLNMKKKAINELNNIEFNPSSNTSNHGGYLDFHYNQSTANYTSRIIEDQSGFIDFYNTHVKIKTVAIDRDAANPSSTLWGKNLWFADANDENIGQVRILRQTDGRITLYLASINEKSDGTEVVNSFQIHVDRNGTQTYGVSNPANFRSAIGAGAVTGVKGGAESSYRTGNVNITRTNLSGCWWVGIVTGVNIAKGGTIGTNTAVFNYNLFLVVLSGGFRAICYLTGSTSSAGVIDGDSSYDDGTHCYGCQVRIAVATNGKMTLTSASSHLHSSSGFQSGTARNVTAVYGLV